MRCEPDGFMGAVMAAQGVRGLKAVVNGPGGCRSRTVNLTRELVQEYRGEDAGCCRSKFNGGVSLVPCTHLNADDIILGSGGKITEGVRSVVSSTGGDVVLIDTLGATVQVTDREEAVRKSGFWDRVVLADENLSGMTMQEGFDDTMLRIVKHYAVWKDHVPDTVNILGYSQGDRSWDYGKRELEHLLSMLGLKVNCFVGCDCSKESLMDVGTSCLNILIHPEMSVRTADWMEGEFGTPYLIPSQGVPLGFDPIRSFLKEVSDATGKDPARALEEVYSAEQHAFRVIRNYDKFVNRIRGYSMALWGQPSDVLPVMRTVYDYFNLAPASVRLCGTADERLNGCVTGYLDKIGFPDSLGRDLPERNLRIYFADGYTAERYGREHDGVLCIGIQMPYPDTVPLSDRCLVGISGTLNLLDQIMNGLREFVCGQPTNAEFR